MHDYNFADLYLVAEEHLLDADFSLVLRRCFPPLVVLRPGLRHRAHDFPLLIKDDKTFISRVLSEHFSLIHYLAANHVHIF